MEVSRNVVRRLMSWIIAGTCLTFIAMSAGCSSSDVSQRATVDGPPLPAGLIKALSIPNTTLKIRVYVNDLTTWTAEADVSVNDGDKTVGDFKVALPVDAHSVRLEYVIVHPTYDDVVVARTAPVAVTLTSSSTILDLSAALIEMPLPDNNGDGTSNLQALIDGNDPGKKTVFDLRVSVIGLSGSVVLQNGADVATIAHDGMYLLSGGLRDQATYDVVVAAQPATQTCIVSGGSGVIRGDVLDVALTCTDIPSSSSLDVIVHVVGLRGTLKLLNGTDSVTLTSDGDYAISRNLNDGASYDITIATVPAGQECALGTNAKSVIAGRSAVIDVTCDVTLYAVNVTVSGMQSTTGLVLKNNGRDEVFASGDGTYTFSGKLPPGRDYSVTVAQQPSFSVGADLMRCATVYGGGVAGSSGVMPAAPISVAVECHVSTAPYYAVGGTIDGLKGLLVLRNNGREEFVATTSSSASAVPYHFPWLVQSGSSYDVVIGQQPSGQLCTVVGATGTNVTKDVTSINVTCKDALTLTAAPLSTEVQLIWDSDALATYDIYVSQTANCDISNYSTKCAGGRMVSNVTHSPYMVTGLTNDQRYFFVVVANYGNAVRLQSSEARALPGALNPDNVVNDIAVVENGRKCDGSPGLTVYLGGSFTSLSADNGGAAALDPRTGDPNFAFRIDGPVHAAIADGNGGWYVGGAFTRVNGESRSNLVHLLADDSVDPAFHVSVSGAVNALLLHNNRLYVGGSFVDVDGDSALKYLAAIDLITGQANSTWTPTPNHFVRTLAAQGSFIYAGGYFTTMNSSPRNAVAKFDDAGTLQSWNPALVPPVSGGSLTVNYIVLVGGHTIIGGQFGAADGKGNVLNGLAALVADGTVDASWLNDGGARNERDSVWTMAATSTTLLVGTWFGTLEIFDAATGAYRGASSRNGYLKLAADNAHIYVLSHYGNGGMALSAFNGPDPSLSQPLWTKSGSTNGGLDFGSTLALGGGRLLVGVKPGMRTASNAAKRSTLAALTDDGCLLPWAPGVDGSVNKLAVTKSGIVASGGFSRARSTSGYEAPRAGMAKFDAAGELLDWNPAQSLPIPFAWVSMVANDSKIYLGGSFTSSAEQPCNYVATIDDASGAVTCWKDEPDSYVNALTLDAAGNVYAGGRFTHAGTAARSALAKFDGAGSLISNWSGTVDSSLEEVTNLALSGNNLYVGHAAGALRLYSADSGARHTQATTIGFRAGRYPYVLRVAGSNLAVAGDFTSIGNTTSLRGLAILSASNFDVLSSLDSAMLSPPTDGYGSAALDASGARLFAGGKTFPYWIDVPLR